MPVSRKRKKKKSKKKKHEYGKKPQMRKSNLNKNLWNKMKSSEMLEGFKIKEGHFKVKVSELILEYGDEYISRCETELEYKKFVPFIIMCWNIGNFPEESEREDGIKKFVTEMHAVVIDMDL
eukprot:TRINITY_DN537_c2_g1_i1.p2 TRINITY_DN537_c2_g1~~TRINITY_DN537_c2_g1_i1.p2  ORF type:complete len:122 (+),score=20.03 TRINITY_DN537_c2_g1_i1:274-639(+)